MVEADECKLRALPLSAARLLCPVPMEPAPAGPSVEPATTELNDDELKTPAAPAGVLDAP